MKVTIQILFVFFFTATLLAPLTAQDSDCPDSLTELMWTASTINSEILWDRSITEAKSNYAKTQSNADLLQLCYAYYGGLTNCLSNWDKEKGKEFAELGIAAAETLLQDDNFKSTANALLAGFNGMSIAFSPMKGMYLGPKSDKQVSNALKLDPTNAIAWLQQGSSQYNTPKIFGGNVKKSIESFKKSIAFFDADPSKPEWMKIEAMVWLGQAYHSNKEYQKASDIYNEVLNLVPGYKWVELQLLPATKAKL